MKNISLALIAASLFVLNGCKAKTETSDLNALVAQVPTDGPREGNNYKVFVKVLRGTPSTPAAVGFNVDAWVKGKSEPVTQVTDKFGVARFENLPFPDAKQRLNIAFRYYKGQMDQTRAIEYPYLDTDAYRMKDTQYIPENVTPEPQ